VNALADLVRRGRPFAFWIVGEGPERTTLEKAVAELGIAQYVRFLGLRERPEDHLALCDLFILPSSEKEGFCNALVEAMALGVPVIATRVGIVPEIITDGKTGWIVAPGDTVALRDTIDRVLALPRGTRAAIGDAGRRRVMETNSPDMYVARLDGIYRAVREGRVPQVSAGL
jgi:glycosyltransferase involved in cell wall biosynthesis